MRRLLSLTLVLATGLVLSAAPAQAGGPTSVLIANYRTGQSAAALNGSAEYTELLSFLGDTPSSSGTPPRAVTASNGDVRLVWLIHDVRPWRIDEVHVVGEDVWVSTYLDTSGTDPYGAAPIRHQPGRGADLVRSLASLGVLGTGTPPGSGSTPALGSDVPAPASTAAEPSTAEVSWRWAVALLLGGVLMGTAVGALLPRGRRLPLVPGRLEAT